MAQEYSSGFDGGFDEQIYPFMIVSHKPHPFGNKYHSIAGEDQGKSDMWKVESVDGKDPAAELGKYKWLKNEE